MIVASDHGPGRQGGQGVGESMPAIQSRIRSGLSAPHGSHVPFELPSVEDAVFSRFETMARLHADRVAVRDGSGSVTYAELCDRAGRLAQTLEPDAAPGRPIALLLENGTPVIVGMLAALKAGGMFVPLDPLHPRERLRVTLADSDAVVIVTNDRNLQQAEAISDGSRVVNIDDPPSAHGGDTRANVGPDDLAYVIYTSGSTGKPKGIVHTHRGLLHCVMNYTNAFQIGFDDRLSLLHSASFSSGIIDIFCALLNGASLHVWDFKERGFGGLAEWIHAQKLTIIDWVPTPFRHFMQVLGDHEVISHVRLLVLASEPVARRDVVAYRRHFDDECVMVNRLGTTEVFNFRLYFLDKQTDPESASVPAGYAVPDKEVVLFDEAGREVGPGVVGEIGIRSKYMAAGYWKMPELTREKFLADPSGGDQTTYLTGDLGRLAADGCLEYLGRKDFQVKVRGHRIEPSEIEAALLEVDGLVAAAVTAPEVSPGERRLEAYVIREPSSSSDAPELRRRLAERLPDYMVPSRFHFVEDLPTTHSGKIDRNGLSSDMVVPGADRRVAAASDEVERSLAEIWSAVLDVPGVNRDDSFLDLGGHSILVARMFERIEREFGVRLPLATLLGAPTLGALTDVIRGSSRLDADEFWSPLVPIQTEGDKLPIYFVHAHGGNVVGFYDLARELGPGQPFYALQARGLDDGRASVGSFEDIAFRYVSEIRKVQPEGPYIIGGFCWGGKLAYEMAQQLHEAGEQVADLVLVDSTPHDYPRYRDTTRFFIPVLRLLDRLVVERTLFQEQRDGRRLSHLRDRARSLREVLWVWLEALLWPFLTRSGIDVKHSRAFHSRRLGILHDEAFDNYRLRPYEGRALLIAAGTQRGGIERDEYLGWRDFLTGPIEVRTVPGPRVGILSEPRVAHTATHISEAIEAATRRQPGRES